MCLIGPQIHVRERPLGDEYQWSLTCARARPRDTSRERLRPEAAYTVYMRIPFSSLPADARLWIFAAERPLAPAEQDRLLAVVDDFLDQWKAHGHPLAGGRDLRYGQFLLVAVDESQEGASGCSIDSMTRSLSELERHLGVELVNHGPVLYRSAEGVARTTRPAFGDRVKTGEITPDTIVFNNTLTRVGDLADQWEVPARASWHGKAFFRS